MTKIKLSISNISLSDFLKVGIQRLFRLDLLRWLLIQRSSITNWHDYCLVKFGLKKTALLQFRAGGTIYVAHESFDKERVGLLSDISQVGGSISPLKDGYLVKMGENASFFVRKLSEVFVLIETFGQKQYKELNVEDKLVVDIGANIGDTAIYFSKIARAKKVLAFEPYPYSYDLAKLNLDMNHVQNVELFNQAVGRESTAIQIDPTYESGIGDDLKSFDSGTSVRVVTLHDIVKMFAIKSGILKIDCEGCEYDVILHSSVEDLQRFEEIVVECHYGYLNIEDKLRSAGFKVKHSPVRFFYNQKSTVPHTYVNLVTAVKFSQAG